MKKPVKKTKATKARKAHHLSRNTLLNRYAKALGIPGSALGAKPRRAGRRKVKRKPVKRTLSLYGPNVTTSSWRDMLKLGRNKGDAAKARLELDLYLMPEQLATPAVVDFASEVVSWPVYGNDQIGDCTAACVGHQIQAWTRYTGTEVDIPEDEIIQLYSAVSGYDPKTGANDNGAVIQDVLTCWRKSGVPVAGHKILAFAELKDLSKIRDALWVFGSVYIGFDCPESALQQFDNGQPWDVDYSSPIAGGHAVPIQYAGQGQYPFQVVTWGKLQSMSMDFAAAYVDEAWVIITQDWLDKNGHTPEGLDLQGLGADLAALTGDPNPFPAPVPPVPPAPPEPPAPVPPAPGPKPDIKADLDQLEQDFAKTVKDVEEVL